ncbi:MAG: S1 RNA-binding domain-containing protein, partial [Kineosporiaceae bacterium]
VSTLADLRPGMMLEGVVTNVAAFGAFIDVGVHQDGLVHVSALSTTFVKDPRDVVKPGDVVRVKVLAVDVPRKRISLTLRLDDGGPRPRKAPERAGGQAGGQDGRGGREGRRRPDPEPGPQGALADALRRAGLAPDTRR